MPDIRNKQTVEAVAREFTSNGRNAELALKAIGYSDNTAEHMSKDVLSSLVVKAAIERIDAVSEAKREWDRELAISALITDRELLKSKANSGDIQAINARTAINRELSAISNLHKQTIVDDRKDLPEIAPDVLKAMQSDARRYKIKLQSHMG